MTLNSVGLDISKLVICKIKDYVGVIPHFIKCILINKAFRIKFILLGFDKSCSVLSGSSSK